MTKPNYPPKPFRENRRDVLIDMIQELRLGLIVTSPALDAVHVPVLVKQDGDKLYLESHVGVANPIWKESDGLEALVVFQGPHAYVHPGWYETKKQTGKAVPTWNYISVQARGTIETRQDAAWMRAHVDALSQVMESGQAEPWAIDDAPDDYIIDMLGGIVGVRIEVTSLEGIWKMSQNHPKANRVGAADGLGAGDDFEVAEIMRDLEAGRR